jgi:CRISPR-associated endonuclease/helicase Cas3
MVRIYLFFSHPPVKMSALTGLELLTTATGNRPFPWQERLLELFLTNELPDSLDIPTGLGKTSVMAIWLVARALGAKLPRRLVYVVDRRAVVDQATDVAQGLRKLVATKSKDWEGLGQENLPISTLRGQFVDNREWRRDPSSAAIIIGTVDMIGSRLLFEGYGIGRKMRPYHAGLLGRDTLVVLDEAHLVPPFEHLLRKIAGDKDDFGPRREEWRGLLPEFRLLSLSATGRETAKTLRIDSRDREPGTETHKRLNAEKRLTFVTTGEGQKLAAALAEHAWKLAAEGADPVRVLVFSNSRKDAEAAEAELRKLAKGKEFSAQLFVGGRRVREREQAATRLRELGFLAGESKELKGPAFVFATSAGEVGVDLDAHHMVGDLVAWERMVQRLGRVNRRGEGKARVIIVREPDPPPPKGAKDAYQKAPADRSAKEDKAIAEYEKKLEVLHAFSAPFEYLERFEDGSLNASPGAFYDLKGRAKENPDLAAAILAATTEEPLRPDLTRAVLDAWSLTSLEKHTGRPLVQPWLRGWEAGGEPQTAVIWRRHLPIVQNGRLYNFKDIGKFFEAAPPHASEILETEAARVGDWLVEGAKFFAKKAASLATQEEKPADQPLGLNEYFAIILDHAGDPERVLKLSDFLDNGQDKKAFDRKLEGLYAQLKDATLVVDARFGGLGKDDSGLLSDGTYASATVTVENDDWIKVEGAPVVPFRVRQSAVPPAKGDAKWNYRFSMPVELSPEEEPIQWLVVEKWRVESATEDDGGVGKLQTLASHQESVERRVGEIGKKLGLPTDALQMLRIAARFHDEGKRAKRWQQAFNAPDPDTIYAKTRGPVSQRVLGGYRHEFTSLDVMAGKPEFQALPPDWRELALHLVAAHHGSARPIISTQGNDLPPTLLEDRARQVTLRFARLQAQWGPWGLAWWEALLRAADQMASAEDQDNPEEKEDQAHG